jgi:tetratricopeptide (TPR) repeat protein
MLALLIASTPAALGPWSPASAQNEFLKQGIAKHDAGQYSEAIGLLGAAQPTDFNNPLLHYYKADCHFRLKENADAIREYQMALILQPHGKMAEYCHSALRALGASTVPPDSVAPIVDPKAEKQIAWARDHHNQEEDERQQKLLELRNNMQNEAEEAYKRAQLDKSMVRSNTPEFISVTGLHQHSSMPNPDFQAAMERIELDTVAKINEINKRFQARSDQINKLYDEREKSYHVTNDDIAQAERNLSKSNLRSSAAPNTQAASPGTVTAIASSGTTSYHSLFPLEIRDQPYDGGQHILRRLNSGGISLMSTVPAMHTSIGMLPLVSEYDMVGKHKRTTYVQIDPDGLWGTESQRKIWKEELIDSPTLRKEWESWEKDVATVTSRAVPNSESSFRLKIARNGAILDMSGCDPTEGPQGIGTDNKPIPKAPSMVPSARVMPALESVPAIPLSSRIKEAHVVIYMTLREDAWWKEH